MRFFIRFLAVGLLVFSCTGNKDNYVFEVRNLLDMPVRKIVEFPKEKSGVLCEVFERYEVRDLESGEFLPSQVIDTDSDGELNILVFRPELGAGESRKYELVLQEKPVDYSGLENRTFSRFVPERTDDYAWENDRVAFRTFGPEAEKMVVEGSPGGTLTSGIDCWLKRVEYPIIDKWYHQDLEEGKPYHEDHGEGLDDFHVGPSRGCGGIGIWDDSAEKLYTSRNFSSWKRIAVGALRTRFELEYEPWETGNGMISEKKVISLDLGSNLMKIEVQLESSNMPELVSAGITLHEKKGHIEADPEKGWFSYWQPHGDSELGMGIVVPPGYLEDYTVYKTDKADRSHLLVHMKPVDGKIVYYAGFGWKKAGRFTSEDEWTAYLEEFSHCLGEGMPELRFKNE